MAACCMQEIVKIDNVSETHVDEENNGSSYDGEPQSVFARLHS
jgi:hypothetical protein